MAQESPLRIGSESLAGLPVKAQDGSKWGMDRK